MSTLLPDGVAHLGECPFTLHDAILTALRVLQYEEFPKDERPPRRIWADSDRLAEWWKEVEHKREARYKSPEESQAEDAWEENAVELIQRG